MPRLFPGWVVIFLFCGILPLSACKQPGQMVLGFATDLSAPNVIDHVTMNVYDTKDHVILTQDWILPGIRERNFKLPGSFTLFADGGAEPTVRVELIGTLGTNPNPVVTRTASIQFTAEQTLFFRMALVQRCMGMVCGAGESCIEGKCKNEVVQAITFKPYDTGREQNVECTSGSALIDTSTQEVMPTDGTGFCGADEWCGEATCYRDEGQGILWCTLPDQTCGSIEGYESCVLAQCAASYATCYGPDWLRGRFGGPCVDYGRCRSDCHCDQACVNACEVSTECKACLTAPGNPDECKRSAEMTTCAEPPCQQIAAMGGTDGMGAGPPDMSTMTLSEPFIPSGVYTIGCDFTDTSCGTDAQPAHQVQMGSFYISSHEATQQEYDNCLQAGLCTAPMLVTSYTPLTTPNQPVVGVTWMQAGVFCAAHAASIGAQQGRLPSEAEWEIAAHGVAGATMPGTKYPFGDTVPVDCTEAVWLGCTPPGPSDVGTHPAGNSPFGVGDLAGNVAEWVSDWYDPNEYSIDADMGVVTNPVGNNPASGMKIVRGGSYVSDANTLRASARTAVAMGTFDSTIGFRCLYLP